MTSLDHLIGLAGATGLLGSAAIVVFVVAREGPAKRPSLGTRGLKRAQALSASPAFAMLEPPLRCVARLTSLLRLGRLRTYLRGLIERSGEHHGLSEDEVLASSALCACGVVVLATITEALLDSSLIWVALGALAGACAPVVFISAVARRRIQRVTLGLPGSIELLAMCMSAGLDLPGSLRRLVECAPSEGEPIIEELKRMLRELDLGNTRRSVMIDFASRVPSAEVRELVNSVVQSEEKGSPLARVLRIQAKTLRLRRSARAEQAASRAALMLVGPTSLIFLCVLTLLLGPVALRFIAGTGMPA